MYVINIHYMSNQLHPRYVVIDDEVGMIYTDILSKATRFTEAEANFFMETVAVRYKKTIFKINLVD